MEFPRLFGARIVRVAVHPDFQRMGYGSKAVQLLYQYYQGNFDGYADGGKNKKDEVAALTEKCNEVEVVEVLHFGFFFILLNNKFKFIKDNELGLLHSEEIAPRANLPPLLVRLKDRPSDRLDYIGVSFGLTLPLLKFWKRLQFLPVYLRQSANDLTGEHSCIMLRTITAKVEGDDTQMELGGHLQIF